MIKFSLEDHDVREEDIERDFETDDSDLNTLNRNDRIVDEVVEAIDALESYYDFLRTTPSEEIDYRTIKTINDYNKLISKKYNIKHSTRSLEAFDEYNPQIAINIALEELQVSMEGMVLDLLKFAWKGLKYIGLTIKKNYGEAKRLLSKLDQVNLSKLTGDRTINFSNASYFTIGNKFDPSKVLENANKVYKDEVVDNGWYRPVKEAFMVINKLPSKLKNVDDLDDFLAITNEELQAGISSKESSIWKTSKETGTNDRPYYEYAISDNIKLLKSRITPSQTGILGDGYKWNTSNSKSKDNNSVSSCDIDTFKLIKKCLKEYVNSERDVIGKVDDLTKELKLYAKRIELVTSKAKNGNWHDIATVGLLIASIMAGMGFVKSLGLIEAKSDLESFKSDVNKEVDKMTSKGTEADKLVGKALKESVSEGVGEASKEIIGINLNEVPMVALIAVAVISLDLFSEFLSKMTKRAVVNPTESEKDFAGKLDKSSQNALSKLVKTTSKYSSSVTKEVIKPYGNLLLIAARYASQSAKG